MFKSKFADALTTMFIGALGIASAENKLSVGYRAEAGHMNPMLEKMCARYCRRSLIITRKRGIAGCAQQTGSGERSRHGHGMDVRAAPAGVWPQGTARCRLGRTTPVLTVCPINPFWWPVTPSTPKFVAHACFGAYKESHYRTIYFHKSGAAVDAAYKKYLAALAQGIERFAASIACLMCWSPWRGWIRGRRRARAATGRRAGVQR